MLTQSLCFLFYFIWVFAYEKRTGKKSHSIFMLFVCQAKDVENERKFSPFTHSTSNGLHPHTSRKNFLSSDLIDVGNFILEIFFSVPIHLVGFCHVFNSEKVSTFHSQYWFDHIKIWTKIILIFRRYLSPALGAGISIFLSGFHRKMKWKCFYMMKNNTSPFLGCRDREMDGKIDG